MDLTSGYPFWPINDGLIRAYPRLDTDTTCHVAVLGGGITGALVALRLIEADIDTIVVDKRDIATGSTAASTALLQYEIDVPLVELIDKLGRENAKRAYVACRDAVDELSAIASTIEDCGFKQKRSLYLARYRRDREVLFREWEARRRIGLSVDFLDASDISERFSFRRPAALLSHEAAQVDAYALTHGLFARGQQRGLRVFDRTRVVGLRPHDAGVSLTTADGVEVKARWLVFATGYETDRFLRPRVARLASTYAIASEPLESLAGWGEDRCLIWEYADPYLYMRTTPDGRVIVGGEDENFRNPELRDRLIPQKAFTLKRRFETMFPEIPLEIAFAWTGTFGITADGLGYTGRHPDWSSTCFALGYGGNGITMSMIAANIIRDEVVGKRNDNAALFRFGR